MCLEFTGSLWSFQKWCQKVKSDEKWASYEVLKMSNFYQTKQWWRHSHSMIINKSQSVSFLHHTNQNYHPARFLIVINHLIRNTQSFAIFAALPRIFRNFSETPAGPRGGEKNCFWGGKTRKNTAKFFLLLRDIYKTLPEAQRTQGIDSIT